MEMDEKACQPVKNLQENSTQFFDKFFNKYQKDMACARGCSSCCFVDLSIFEAEAKLIVDWVRSLPGQEKEAFLERLSAIEERKNSLGKTSCAFLDAQGACSIYPVRPILCRTQGLPLQVKTPGTQGEEIIQVDACPLNFKETFPEKNDWLALDRLNTLLSIGENFYQNNKKESAVSALKAENGRISLKKLREYIIECDD